MEASTCPRLCHPHVPRYQELGQGLPAPLQLLKGEAGTSTECGNRPPNRKYIKMLRHHCRGAKGHLGQRKSMTQEGQELQVMPLLPRARPCRPQCPHQRPGTKVPSPSFFFFVLFVIAKPPVSHTRPPILSHLPFAPLDLRMDGLG